MEKDINEPLLDQSSPNRINSEEDRQSKSLDKPVKLKKKVQFLQEEANEEFFIDPEDTPTNAHICSKLMQIFRESYPMFLTKVMSQLPQLMVLYSIGHQTNPLKENIYESYFLGHSIMYFWCVIPMRGINKKLSGDELPRLIPQSKKYMQQIL